MNKQNKTLLIILVVLLAVYFGNEYMSSDNRNFRDTLVALDTAAVDKIELYPRANEQQLITLRRQGSGWQLQAGNLTDDADISLVKGMLNELVDMRPQRLVATSSEQWAAHEVADSLGTRVKVYDGEKLLADFIVGKFNFQPATRSMSTSVRLAEDEDVYTVEGFMSSTFNRKASDLRDKTFINFDNSQLQELTFTYPADSGFVLSKNAAGWLVDIDPADSAAVAGYLSSIKTLRFNTFADQTPAGAPDYRLQISRSGLPAITLSAYADSSGYVYHSTLNPDAYFKSGSDRERKRLFVSRSKFVRQ